MPLLHDSLLWFFTSKLHCSLLSFFTSSGIFLSSDDFGKVLAVYFSKLLSCRDGFEPSQVHNFFLDMRRLRWLGMKLT